MSQDVAHLAPTRHNAKRLLERSTLTHTRMGEKTMVLTCQLPNGFEVTVSSAPVDADEFDDELGLESCMEKLETRVIDLLAFQAHGPLE